MRTILSPARSIALASMIGLASGCSGDPVTVVSVPADQIKDAQPAPPPPAPVRGKKKIGPRGGMSAAIAPGYEANSGQAK